MKMYVREKQAEEKTFYYVEIGAEDHYHPTFIIWVHPSFIKTDGSGNYIEFPIRNCQIIKGKGKGLILKKGDKNLFYFTIGAGFRGKSTIENIDCYGNECEVYKFFDYDSPRGSTGIDEGALILTKSEKVKIKWSRNGRLYGKAPKGITILYIDGREEQLECVDDEDLKLLITELE
jgi:hypothetical protein